MEGNRKNQQNSLLRSVNEGPFGHWLHVSVLKDRLSFLDSNCINVELTIKLWRKVTVSVFEKVCEFLRLGDEFRVVRVVFRDLSVIGNQHRSGGDHPSVNIEIQKQILRQILVSSSCVRSIRVDLESAFCSSDDWRLFFEAFMEGEPKLSPNLWLELSGSCVYEPPFDLRSLFGEIHVFKGLALCDVEDSVLGWMAEVKHLTALKLERIRYSSKNVSLIQRLCSNNAELSYLDLEDFAKHVNVNPFQDVPFRALSHLRITNRRSRPLPLIYNYWLKRMPNLKRVDWHVYYKDDDYESPNRLGVTPTQVDALCEKLTHFFCGSGDFFYMQEFLILLFRCPGLTSLDLQPRYSLMDVDSSNVVQFPVGVFRNLLEVRLGALPQMNLLSTRLVDFLNRNNIQLSHLSLYLNEEYVSSVEQGKLPLSNTGTLSIFYNGNPSIQVADNHTYYSVVSKSIEKNVVETLILPEFPHTTKRNVLNSWFGVFKRARVKRLLLSCHQDVLSTVTSDMLKRAVEENSILSKITIVLAGDTHHDPQQIATMLTQLSDYETYTKKQKVCARSVLTGIPATPQDLSDDKVLQKRVAQVQRQFTLPLLLVQELEDFLCTSELDEVSFLSLPE